MTRHFAIIPSAGIGARLGSSTPKAWVRILGRSIVEWSLRSILAEEAFSSVVVLVDNLEREECRELEQLDSRIVIRKGGATRQQSVAAGIRSLSGQPDDLVLVHDAARCLVSARLITSALAAAKVQGAVTAAIPVADTMTTVSAAGEIGDVIQRESVARIQTPQAFRFNLLQEAHERAAALGLEATDDAQLVRRLHPVFYLEGEASNIKITHPGDLEIAAAVLEARKITSSGTTLQK